MKDIFSIITIIAIIVASISFIGVFILSALILVWKRRASAEFEMRKRLEQSVLDHRTLTSSLQEKIKWSEALLSMLPDYISELLSSHTKDEVISRSITLSNFLLDSKRTVFFWWDEKRERYIPYSLSSIYKIEIKQGETIIGASGLLKIPLTMEDYRFAVSQRKDIKFERIPDIDLEIALPVMTRIKTYGVIATTPQTKDITEVKRLLQIVAEITGVALENIELFNRIENIAVTDTLTGLWNRSFLFTQFSRDLESARKRLRPISVIMFDLDHFKSFNDTYGHLVGDKILKKLSNVLKVSTKNKGWVARYGGEEFLVVLSETTKDEAFHTAEKIRKDIENMRFDIDKTTTLNLTISGGIASFPFDGDETESLIKSADDALYKAKEGGRNRIIPA